MRGFLYVTGLLAGGIVLAFVLALLNAKEPMERLPAQLTAGGELTGDAAQQAFASWFEALPAEPATPVRLKLELTGTGAVLDNAGAAASVECSLDLTLADPRRGRAELKLRVQEPGQPLVEGSGVFLADGQTMWVWGKFEGVNGPDAREGAYSVKQSLVEDAWINLRARLPELMRLAAIPGLTAGAAPPSSVLLLLHPAWLCRSLTAWPCTGLRLEGDELTARFQPGADLAGLELLATFDARTGLPVQLDLAGPAAATGGSKTLHVRISQLDKDIPAALFLPPAGLQAQDVSPLALMAVAAVNAALQAGVAPSDSEF